MKSVAVMGSTGSIGRQTLDIVRCFPDIFEVGVLAAGSNVEVIAHQAQEFRPPLVGLSDEHAARQLQTLLGPSFTVLSGDELIAAVGSTDLVVNAVMGFAGIRVTEQALKAGATLALANKESLIAAGDLVLALVHGGGELIPVDSEHSAIFQLLGRSRQVPAGLARLVITASGGPFRLLPLADLEHVSVENALAHPTWSMGPKISVDSSTLFNKGLEVIEAHYLFGVPYDLISVLVHPESLVHSMVELSDGTTLAQLSMPDMRLPISLALFHPERSPEPYGAMQWSSGMSLTFGEVDRERFPALELAFSVGSAGGGAPCWMNAANEVAVEAFLAGSIRWVEIYRTVAAAMDRYEPCAPMSIEEVIALDEQARRVARETVGALTGA